MPDLWSVATWKAASSGGRLAPRTSRTIVGLDRPQATTALAAAIPPALSRPLTHAPNKAEQVARRLLVARRTVPGFQPPTPLAGLTLLREVWGPEHFYADTLGSKWQRQFREEMNMTETEDVERQSNVRQVFPPGQHL